MDDLKKISSVFSEEYLSDRLTSWFQKEISFTNAKFLGEAKIKGDAYLSDVHRIVISGKVKLPKPSEDSDVSIQIVLKTFPSNIGYRNTFRSHTFFKNEINFYTIVMPELLKFQSDKNVKDPFTNIPRVFAAVTNGVDDILALEDMRVFNFVTPLRMLNTDPVQMKIILDTFAKFHALSFAFKDQHPEKYEELTSHIMEVYFNPIFWDWYKGFWRLLCKISVDAISKEYPNTIYEEKVKNFAKDETFFRATKAAMEKRSSSVLSHGDSWTTNFLFQYKDNLPMKSVMIDFQLARSASPILDIAFFIYACGLEREYLKENYNSILKCYYDKLAIQIRELGSDPDKIYPWQEFVEEVKELSFFGAAFAMECIPGVVLEPEDVLESLEIPGTEAVPVEQVWCLESIKTQKGRQRLCDVFIHAIDKGYV